MTKKRSFVLITLLAAMSCLNANEFESNEAITKLNKATSLTGVSNNELLLPIPF